MDPMGQGGTQPRALRAAANRSTALRRASSAALAAVVTFAGCNGSSSDPADDLPPLPRYWQGSISGPQDDAWATHDPWASGPPRNEAPALRGWPPSDAAASMSEPDMTTAGAATRDSERSSPDSATVADAPPQASAASPTPTQLPPVAAAVDQPRELTAMPSSPSGRLLPPEALPVYDPEPAAVAAVEQTPLVFPPHQSSTNLPTPAFPVADQRRAPAAPAVGLVMPAAHAAPGPTGSVVNDRARTHIRRGYELASRDAYFAARNEFIASLQLIAAAKDQRFGSPRRTVALAEGLRALDESEDFFPPSAVISPATAAVIVAAHRTPVAKGFPVESMLPEQLVDAYLSYADEQLAAAVAGEPAGSMALHALGKLESRLGVMEPQSHRQADRRAFALQQAALLARSDNHLAAHELGVLLAESGHYGDSNHLLRQVAAHAPHPVVFRNLARVQRQLGQPGLAVASERQAEFLAMRGVGGDGPVQWVSADALARTPDPLAPSAAPARMATAPAQQPMQR
jgi:hypothetical protein